MKHTAVPYCDLVRHFCLEIMTVLFDEQSGLCSELYHNDGKQGADIYSLNSHFNWNWGIVKHALPQGFILCHMLFLLYIQLSVQSQCLYTNCLIPYMTECLVSHKATSSRTVIMVSFHSLTKGLK
jgi:hypothetical protein